MSMEEPLSRKDKKAQRDAQRHKKGKKRKIADRDEDAVIAPVNPEVDALADDVEPANSVPEKIKKERKQRTNGSDLKADAAQATEAATGRNSSRSKRKAESEDHGEEAEAEVASAQKQSHKKRKRDDGTSVETAVGGDAQDNEAQEKPSKSRFIVFVGNLPFTTTDASLQAHFKKLVPFSLRHRTDPKTKKSKGFAFLEFENYDRMKTCLQLYHHSMFDPEDKENGGSGKGNGKRARKINVELTAGGGGKASGRKEKIKAKNERLDEQRKRRNEARKKAEDRKEKKEAMKKPAGDEEGTAEAPEAAPSDSLGGMHPSRLARLNA